MDDTTKEIVDDLNKPLDPNCKHELKPCGCWDGFDTNRNWIYGAIYRCKKCKGTTYHKEINKWRQ